MRIASQLSLAAALPVLVVLVIGAVLWGARLRVERITALVDTADQVRRINFDLVILAQEVQLYGGVRSERQLRQRLDTLAALLSGPQFDAPDERPLRDSLRQDQRDLERLFSLLAAAPREAHPLLGGAVIVKAQYLRQKTADLAERLHAREQAIEQQGFLMVAATLIALAGLSLVLAIRLSRRLRRGIADLNAGIRRVVANDLKTRIPATGKDEFADLARGFNRMTGALEIARAELNNFTYSVSHDLRAPLRAIDGFAAILRDEYAPILDDEGRRLLQVVSDHAQKMGRLIEDLLAFSRASRHELQLGRLDMNALAREVWQELAVLPPGRCIDFRLGELPAAAGDASATRVVLQNLLANAIKFSRGRTPAVIEVDGRRAGDECTYCVRDNGDGFDMAYVHKLFGLFQRLHSMETFEGTGMGLAIVKRFVDKHGGRVWAEGLPGHGATFCFTLPATPAAYYEETRNGQALEG